MKRIIDGNTADAPGEAMGELPVGAAGVFETLLLRCGAPVFWREHWARFARGCQAHGFAPPMESELLAAQVAKLAAENEVADGVIRFAAWRSTGGTPTWQLEVGPPRPHMRRAEFRVGWGPTLPAATMVHQFKHLSRTAWLDALRAARAAGDDEALLCDNTGRLVEGSVSNVFFVCEGIIHTPDLASGPLPGVMRGQVLALAHERGWPVREAVFVAADIEMADEIWLTNSLIGLRPVAQLAGRRLPAAKPVLDEFCAAWRTKYGWDPVVVISAG